MGSVEKFHYDLSAAWYLDIAKLDTIVISAASKKADIAFELPIERGDNLYLSGQQKIRKAFYKLKLQETYERTQARTVDT
jgi:hypothetical protein